MTDVLLDSPAPLTFAAEAGEEMGSERPARLLETGDYPDKGLTLTEADLDEIVARFAAGRAASAVPVKVEHVDSPLDPLGQVKRVWREGAALLGTLAFPDDLAGFLRRRGAAKLSVGLTREPLALCEVSLVLKPRIAGAVLLGAEASSPSPTPGASAVPSPASGRGESDKEREIVRLRAEIVAREVDAQIAAFKAQGRIVPASEAPARALLASAGEAMVTLAAGAGADCAVCSAAFWKRSRPWCPSARPRARKRGTLRSSHTTNIRSYQSVSEWTRRKSRL